MEHDDVNDDTDGHSDDDNDDDDDGDFNEDFINICITLRMQDLTLPLRASVSTRKALFVTSQNFQLFRDFPVSWKRFLYKAQQEESLPFFSC